MSTFLFSAWPGEQRRITQFFGANPRLYAGFQLPGHDGVDIFAPEGSQVFAVAPGRVARVQRQPGAHRYGVHVLLHHQDGYQTVYAHLQEARVRQDQAVDAGTVLGLAGSSGNSFGPHLHLGLMQDGASQGHWPHHIIDPTPFLLPLLGWQEPAGPFLEGWLLRQSLTIFGNLAQVNAGGAHLRQEPGKSVFIPEGTLAALMEAEGGSAAYVRALVPRVALPGAQPDPVPVPPLPPDDSRSLVSLEGWGRAEHLHLMERRAVVGHHGLQLRQSPSRESMIIGLVRRGSSVTVRGSQSGDFLPVLVRRADFMGQVQLPAPLLGQSQGAILGWTRTQYLSVSGRQGVVRHAGCQLLTRPEPDAPVFGQVKGFATVTLASEQRGDFSPVLVRRQDVVNLVEPLPEVEKPGTRPLGGLAPAPVIGNSTPGWLLSAGLEVRGDSGQLGRRGLNLHPLPRADGPSLGFVPALSRVIVTGPAQGSYTPVRVDDLRLQPAQETGEEVPLLGRALIGLHASADATISQAELEEFAALRPGMIKLLSWHPAADIRRLAEAHPQARWIVRASLDFGGRSISPGQFFDYTLGDVQRALGELKGKDVVVELHNEPNVAAEGLGRSWQGGAGFAAWWLELLGQYRRAIPQGRFIYPGLSPGSSVRGLKQDHVEFIETSREAVKAADGLAVHLTWSSVSPLPEALAVLDDLLSRFRQKEVWVSEASYKGKMPAARRAGQYVRFWHALQQRPLVQGVTFFVASASAPRFKDEAWVGQGIGRMLGMR